MRKSILLFTIVAIVASLYLAGIAQAAHKIQNTGRGVITLNRVPNAEDVPESASGTARFRVSSKADGFYKMTVRVRVNSLPERAGQVYEVWLKDDNGDGGYALSLGTFQTNGGQTGRGGLTIKRTITKLSPFDKIVVTRENKNDDNPNISDTEVLEGELAH